MKKNADLERKSVAFLLTQKSSFIQALVINCIISCVFCEGCICATLILLSIFQLAPLPLPSVSNAQNSWYMSRMLSADALIGVRAHESGLELMARARSVANCILCRLELACLATTVCGWLGLGGVQDLWAG